MSTDLCPWLGTEQDREIRHAGAAESHVCYAREPVADVDLDYQAEYCLVARHRDCVHYRPPPAVSASPATFAYEEMGDEIGPLPRAFPTLRVLLWAAVVVIGVIAAYTYGSSLLTPAPSPTAVAVGTADRTFTASPSPGLPLATVSPRPSFAFRDPTATPTPYPGGSIYGLAPQSDAAGWVASDESRGNHLGDSYLYSGVFEGVIYHGIFQFDLSNIPRGATIHGATLELTGLDARRLAAGGAWEVRILQREVDEDWARIGYQEIHNAAVQWSLAPALGPDDLAPGQVNALPFLEEQLRDLEMRLLEEHYTLSVRIDGPLAGGDNLFAWDTGHGTATQGNEPRLLLSVGAPPKTPLPSGTPPFVVVTSTPTPANVLTAAARDQTATSVATTIGYPTPTSIYEWTATPAIIVTNTPTPANRATADQVEAVMTAIALTTGTFTPTPGHLKTATATPILLPMDSLTSTPSPSPPAPTPPLPDVLQGQILFQSDRAGEGVGPWVMNAEGRAVALLTAAWPYEVAASREALSADGARQVYVGQTAAGAGLLVRPIGEREGRVVVSFELGRLSTPVWSPVRDQIAFVATASGAEQIWLVNVDGSGLRQLTLDDWGSANQPSFSPDGNRLAYAGVRPDGRRQVFTINLSGTNRANISNNSYDEWAPIWVK